MRSTLPRAARAAVRRRDHFSKVMRRHLSDLLFVDFGRLSNFDRICREHGVPIETDADDAGGTLVAL